MAKLCACGCGKPAAAGSIYFDQTRCKTRKWRRKVAERTEAAGLPKNLNLTVLAQYPKTGIGDAEKPGRKPRRRAPELRISYRKAVDAIVSTFVGSWDPDDLDEPAVREMASEALTPLLSEKARRSL